MYTFETLKVTVNNDHTVLVQFNRPEKRNAFSQGMIDDLVACLGLLDHDESVRAVVLAGGPSGPFCGRSLHLHPSLPADCRMFPFPLPLAADVTSS